MPVRKKPTDVRRMIGDESVDREIRRRLLLQLCMSDDDVSTKVMDSVLASIASRNEKRIYEKKLTEVSELIQEMREGPMREATFVSLVEPGAEPCRATVVLDDGSSAITIVPDAELAASLQCGDSVLVEGRGRAVLARGPGIPPAGEEARVERTLGGGRVEVTLNHGRSVFLATAAVLNELEREEPAGRTVLVCPRRRIVLDTLPETDGFAHYRFLDRTPVSSLTRIEEIGDPPAFIEDVAEEMRLEMTDPAARRRFRVRPSVTKLLAGTSGTGKSMSIRALTRRIYEVTADATGIALEDLPPRVLKLSAAQYLSKWLGESDQNLSRFFDEVRELSKQTVVAADGAERRIPVVAVLEEVDGLARRRGQDALYDRILTTALDRLDTGRSELGEAMVVFLATTNVPEQVDAAFLRRIGGTVERFGRPSRRQFARILEKHVDGLPLVSADGEPLDVAAAVSRLTGWLYGPSPDAGQVAVDFVGSTKPSTYHRRDFLTGSVVDLAVQQAADTACRESALGIVDGLSAERIMWALDRQVRGIVDQLHVENVAHFIDLPEGVRVAGVRRIAAPSLQPFQLERSA